MSFIHKQLLIEALRFALVGAVATALHYGLYLLLLAVMPANAAYTLGYVVSFVVNFYLTAYFTFGTGPSWRKLVGMGGCACRELRFAPVSAQCVFGIGRDRGMGAAPGICHCHSGELSAGSLRV